jgi:hypothetical protein
VRLFGWIPMHALCTALEMYWCSIQHPTKSGMLDSEPSRGADDSVAGRSSSILGVLLLYSTLSSSWDEVRQQATSACTARSTYVRNFRCWLALPLSPLRTN